MQVNYLTLPLATKRVEPIIYPESDGQPMADNTLQFFWIVTIEGSLEAMFKNDPNVFVAGDLLWYPVEGNPRIRRAPDVLVVFGRPKGHRGSYRQWEEDNIPPQVVFEILSPGNTEKEMKKKLAFYDRYEVEEYYEYGPHNGTLQGWYRYRGRLVPITQMDGWMSPRLGVSFKMKGKEILLSYPDGRPFSSYVELDQQREAEIAARKVEVKARRAAEAKARQAEAEIARLKALLAQNESQNN